MDANARVRPPVHGSVTDLVTLAPPPLPVTVITVPPRMFEGAKVQTTLPPDIVQLSAKVVVADCVVTSNGIVALTVAPAESFTVTKTEYDPLAVDVPETAPLELRLKPGTEADPEKVYGTVPPEAVIPAE